MTKRLGGRYELQTVIGGGGMAIVYKAVDTLLDRTVAVKMLRAQYAGDEEFVNRFRQEAQSAARLSHPNIVNLYDVGMSDGEYYIVMEYVDGPTLKDLIRDRGPLPVHEALDITEQICDALAHAHDHRIIHRDVKPHNILITQRGQVKVTDFGIARAVTGNTITHHNDTSVLGSVHYFSPEQARGATVSAKSDIYSLGVVMYEMLTKKLPFSGDSPVSVALKHLRDHFVEPRELNPLIPQSVENIILRCLVKSPDLRYADMRAVKADLLTALIHPDVPKFHVPSDAIDETISIPAVGGRMRATEPEAEDSDEESVEELTPPSRGRRVWRTLMWIGIVLAVLVVGVLAAYYIVMDIAQVPNVNLPNVVGQPQAKAVALIEKAGIPQTQIHIQDAFNSQQPKGYVYSQNPTGPQQVKQTRDIQLYVSDGAHKIQIPDLAGMPADQAKSTLSSDGFSNVTDNPVQSVSVAVGDVVSSNPPANALVTPNTHIVLNISQGAETQVPNVYGKTVSQATQILQNAHLAVGQVTQIQFAAPNGTIVKMFPYNPGDTVPAGTSIDLWVASNAGGSSPGNSIGNSTGGSANSTGASLDNLPPNTHVRPVTIKVADPSGKPVVVQIIKSDAVSQNEQVVSQTITSTSTWNITMYLTPNSQGEIQVYENGKLEQDYPVQY